MAEAILEVKDKLFPCSTCNSITAVDPCTICSDPERDQGSICVVEEPFNIQPLERTGEFRGLYHVLMGALSPQRGIGPEQLEIPGLLARLDDVQGSHSRHQPGCRGRGHRPVPGAPTSTQGDCA